MRGYVFPRQQKQKGVDQRPDRVRDRLWAKKCDGKIEFAGKTGKEHLYRSPPAQGELEVVA